MISQLEKEITLRYLKTRKKDGFLNIISIFSFIGISLGVAVLIIVMSVMNGFRTELVDKIVYTYKFTTLPNIDDLRDECKIWLTTVLDKFNPDKGSKAFSYFSVITKNWFIHKVKKHAIQRQREITFDQMPRHIEEKYLSTVNPYEEEVELRQFRAALNAEIDKWGQMPMKASEEKVYKAVKILLENPDDIEIFNKKAIYLYLRELTGLNTKQVVSNLNKLREKYKVFKADWDEGNVSHIDGEINECRVAKEKDKL